MVLGAILSVPTRSSTANCPSRLFPLFTIDKKRDIIVCISSGRDRALRTHELLSKDRFLRSILDMPIVNPVNLSLKVATYLQRLALAFAKKRRMTECTFLGIRRDWTSVID